MVKVRRHRSISIAYLDPAGGTHTWADLDPATSELLQHEIDHLDGVLMIDRTSREQRGGALRALREGGTYAPSREDEPENGGELMRGRPAGEAEERPRLMREG
jgi:peptide deformylase